jgi:uncharacterized Tic20 family protein
VNADPDQPGPAYAPPHGPHADPLHDPQAAAWERTWASICHLTIFILPVFWFPVVPALVAWLVRRNESPFIDDHGREVVNFHITMLVYAGIVFCLKFICIGWLLVIPLAAFGYICAVIGAVSASKGRYFRYPMCLRFLH